MRAARTAQPRAITWPKGSESCTAIGGASGSAADSTPCRSASSAAACSGASSSPLPQSSA
eukprot:5704941-Prymnesium_polylepis.1